MRKNILVYGFVLGVLLFTVKANATIRYVKTGSAGTAPYTTWATASNDLQAVINQCIAGDEIWIATGTYKPNRRADALTVITATDRNDAFVLKNAVKVYGGFTGVETLLSQRNSTANVATLSGDIGTVGVTTDNCYHVVILANTASTTTLMDGVSIISGNANAAALVPSITVNTFSINPRFGGGMYKVSSAADITDCKFRRNDASLSGAGIYETLSSSASVYTNCSVVQNVCADDGGGIYILTSSCLYQTCSFTTNDAADKGAGIYISGTGSPAFTDCTISSNDAVGEGGAAYLTGSGSPTFTGCTINSNTAVSNGGAVACYVSGTAGITATIISGNTSSSTGGGLYNNNSPVALTNCLISGNLASGGGGIWNALSDATIINCTIAGNRATAQGGGIANGTSTPTIQNCIVYGNTGVPVGTNTFYNSGSTPVVDYSLIEGGYAGTGNVNANPLFITPVAAAAAPTIAGDYRVQSCSPVLNAGNNAFIPSGITTDLDANGRVNYGVVDIGAYEKQLVFAVPDASGIVYVDITKTGNGSSWANAVPQLADAMVAAKFNTAILQIWVAKGTYYPKYRPSYSPLACNSPDVNSSFVFANNLKVYGGFAGGETDTTGRNYVTNKTTLSGDIGVLGNNADNCNNVVRSFNVGASSEFNGFTVTMGNGSYGSGLDNNNSDLVITNCIFSNNIAGVNGGAMNNAYSSPVITNCSFLHNAANVGAGMHNFYGSVVKIYNCVFTGNTASLNGGAIANFDNARIEMYNSQVLLNQSGSLGGGMLLEDDSQPSKLVDCIFSGNESGDVGGGICSHNSSEFINCLVSGNKSNDGAGIHFRSGFTGPYLVENCTIACNAGIGQGGALFIADHTAVVRNSIVFGNSGGTIVDGSADIAYSLVQGALYPGAGNINSNPLFISQILAASAPSISGDYHLQKCGASPAIDAGSTGFVPAGITKDLDEQARTVNGKVDMGAYETHYAFQNGGKIYVDKTKTGKGSSWADAAPELADALKEAKYNATINEIWVANGTYNPLYNATDGAEIFCKMPGRDNAFVLPANVKVYGGFAGGEADTSGRNFVTNETILSGDIGVANNNTDNCYHVVISSGAVGSAELNGFTVINGNADGGSSINVNGQLIRKDNGGGINNTYSSPAVTNCIILGNSSSGNGAGINNSFASPTIANCTISNNGLSLSGGGIYNSSSAPIVTNSTISGNSAFEGGGGNYDINPLFIAPVPPAAAPTTLGDYRLQACSPALNLGDNSFIPPGLAKDLDSLDRIKYATVDMGAYELQTIDLANTTWRGFNTNWNDKVNWCGGFIPSDTTNVTVPLTGNNPLINTGYDNEVKNISFANNTSIGIANSGKFTINGTYTNLGSTISNNGDWVMAGNAASQTFPGPLATVSAMNNLEINNPAGLKLDKSFELTGTLTPTAGNINIDNATITLNSDATSTARVASISPGVAFSYTGTGKFEVERYIPPHRAWRLLTAPLSTATNLTINQAWQEGVSNANRVTPVNPAAGFGTTITKSTTYNVADGYDQGSTNNPSIRYYNGTNWGGFPSGTIGTTPGANNGLINDQPGYMLFVRGDRSIQVAGVGVTATVTTLRPKGQLKTGPQTIVCNGWTVIGNPYASPINFHQIVADNPGLPDVFYVWDANLAGSSNVGGWVSYGSYNGGSQTYTVAPVLSGSTFANNKGDISSGSAFMVNYTGTITINENHKSTLGDNVLYRPVRLLSINLYVVNADSSESLNDGIAIKMEASPQVANTEKNKNFTENLAIAFDNKFYAIQNRPRPNFNDTIFISSGQMKQRNYVLEIKADELNMPNQMKAFLEDTYLRRYLPVALEGSTRYYFTVNADSASISAARFRLLFKKSARFKHVFAAVKEKDIEVQWEMEDDFGIEQYEVERSLSGMDFTVMMRPSANGHQPPQLQNQWLDRTPATGTYYYRIKATGMDGRVLYSDIVKACMVENGGGMYVYPNPVTGNKFC
jgi:parallel beta-helix repeat protein